MQKSIGKLTIQYKTLQTCLESFSQAVWTVRLTPKHPRHIRGHYAKYTMHIYTMHNNTMRITLQV